MNRNVLSAALACIPTIFGLMLSAPASGDDLGQQVCNAIGREGTSLRGFLNVDRMLMQAGHRRDFDIVVHQSVANDCPQYQDALAEADREAAGVNGGIMGCAPGTTYMPSQGRCER